MLRCTPTHPPARTQASRAVRHGAALLRRWPALRDAPHPDLLLLVVHQDLLPPFLLDPSSPHAPQLPSAPAAAAAAVPSAGIEHGCAPGLAQRARAAATSAGARLRRLSGAGQLGGGSAAAGAESAAVEVLSELQRVVSLAKALGLGVLLAVVSPGLLGAAARRRLAASVGLDGTTGAVVPMPLLPLEPPHAQPDEAAPQLGSSSSSSGEQGKERGQQLRVPLLQAALFSHALALRQERAERGVEGPWEAWPRARL